MEVSASNLPFQRMVKMVFPDFDGTVDGTEYMFVVGNDLLVWVRTLIVSQKHKARTIQMM